MNKLLKPLILLLLLAFIQPAVGQQQKKLYSISGTVNGETNKQVRIQAKDGSEADQVCKIIDGKFFFKGEIDVPKEFRIKLEEHEYSIDYMRSFFIEPGATIKINLNVKYIEASQIVGGQTENEYRRLVVERDSIKFGPTRKRIIKDWNLASVKKDSTQLKKILAENGEMKEDIKKWTVDYILRHPKSYVSAYQLFELHKDEVLKPVEKIKILDKLDPSLSSLNAIALVKSSLNNQIGQPVTDFTLSDVAGKQVKYSDIARNNVTFIDFWWSGCAPCRIENPHLQKIYQNFKAKGFEIVGVSSDKVQKTWLDAIKKDGITWTNLIDSQKKVNESFFVQMWPYNFLVDSNGIVLAKNLSTEELKTQLELLLK